MTIGGAPTPSGARTGAYKAQVGHGFRRGQPLYLNPATGLYALATTATGFDGVVGSVRDANRFELVTGGELDNCPNLQGTSPLYLSSTPGVLATTGTVLVLRPQSGSAALVLPYIPVTASSATAADTRTDAELAADLGPLILSDHLDPTTNPHPQYVRIPAYGGILDVENGNLVFDVEHETQVLLDTAAP